MDHFCLGLTKSASVYIFSTLTHKSHRNSSKILSDFLQKIASGQHGIVPSHETVATDLYGGKIPHLGVIDTVGGLDDDVEVAVSEPSECVVDLEDSTGGIQEEHGLIQDLMGLGPVSIKLCVRAGAASLANLAITCNMHQ